MFISTGFLLAVTAILLRFVAHSSRHNMDSSNEDEEDLVNPKVHDDLLDHSKGANAPSFQLFEESEVFLQATFGSHLEFASQKAKVAKYGTPNTIWLQCPELSKVVGAFLSKKAMKENKVAFKAHKMWLEAATILAALLKKTDDSSFSITDAIPMIQSALMLMGDASQYQASLRRKILLEHLNPKLKSLMSNKDFSKAHPLLLSEDFGEKAKSRLEVAAVLQNATSTKTLSSYRQGFQKGYPRRNT